ncbi:unnamed protein product [Acanthoscelides obtectus]|uniref:Uncharacterized protein n=1 Tax=Acanthoscelides obtectus TaxID=200917 RepID=A0A9P0JUH2_ACAOB|nr:unnamed protein product [Acanthoscelides obtectus]CAK1627875.1 hypothetical protein AOBTE_LOCUS4881 [Acanthoscelides obtectus]
MSHRILLKCQTVARELEPYFCFKTPASVTSKICGIALWSAKAIGKYPYLE